MIKVIYSIKQYIKHIFEMIESIFTFTLRKKRNKALINKDFTIISNNCWAGMVYRRLNIQYLTPTIGLYIYPKDFIKFVTNLKYYLEIPLVMINENASKYKNDIKILRETHYFPIGKLDDIEIIFLHYKSDSEAVEKWNRRKQRVNYDKLIIKMNDQNGCRYEDIESFFNLKWNNKIFFSGKQYCNMSEVICIPSKKSEYVTNDMNIFINNRFNIINYINNIK